MNINAIDLVSQETEQHELSAMVNGERIFYRCYADLPVRKTYDPFLLAAAVPSMELTGDLSIEDEQPVSKKLVEGLNQVSQIYSGWKKGLKPLNINVNNECVQATDNQLVGCFFSGGIDSLYSYILHKEKITHLVICRGLDIPLEREEPRWQRTKQVIEDFAKSEGKEVVIIETNVKEKLLLPYMKSECWGLNLISTALWLGFSKLIVPSSTSFDDLRLDGSHILVDPLASTEYTQVIHDDLERRTLKTKKIIDTGIGLDIIRVCNVFSEYNCGICEKCLRTRTALCLYGATTKALEPLVPSKHSKLLMSMYMKNDLIYPIWVELYELALEQNHIELSKLLSKVLKKYRIKKLFKQFDQDVLGGIIAKTKSLVW